MRDYNIRIQERNAFRYAIGLIIRLLFFLFYYSVKCLSNLRGAQIGKNTIIPLGLALKANKNLVIGDNCIIETTDIDLRGRICIKNNCIIGKKVSIIRLSHDIDSGYFETKSHPILIIDDYCWLATGACVLPSVSFIEKGSVLGAYSVLVKNTSQNGVYSGNPASLLRNHAQKHENLVVSSLKGGDLCYYFSARFKNDICY